VSLFFCFLDYIFLLGALSIKKSDLTKYNSVIRSHRCEKNYDKNSGGIESAAVLNMFQRSVAKYGIYYTKYVGDGDSKAFAMLTKTTPYPGIIKCFIPKIITFNTEALTIVFIF
jgi:hypothetical protein